ncbi:hypothetical protein GCM10027047_00150 [Rhodococcus aerolatus]
MEQGAVDGFGRYGQLETVLGGEEVRCHECGVTRRSLGTHANQVHGLTAAAYRTAHGLSAATSLSAPATRRS